MDELERHGHAQAGDHQDIDGPGGRKGRHMIIVCDEVVRPGSPREIQIADVRPGISRLPGKPRIHVPSPRKPVLTSAFRTLNLLRIALDVSLCETGV
ncbi:hypothetical protein [Nonomuraea sp. NPDC049480]|uniref:hypothetical protein n=1 Tax=Nonomuraea sp. NPDC049480 TaxID=3364353 RepID=UPI00379AC80B